jgi:nanoRNase/pAp phosphatase (c-di-AMP/oligoRNAs hydrolase)
LYCYAGGGHKIRAGARIVGIEKEKIIKKIMEKITEVLV